ncbi:MAG: DF family (seleno)protein [Chloroflexota bacterium]
MTVELLYFDGCPNHRDYLPRLRTLLATAGIKQEVAPRRIDGQDEAVAQRFLGSPSVRVNGQDVEVGARTRTDYGLQCRLYRASNGWSGTPPDEWVLDALRQAAAAPDGS